jgi:hypothetical protein
MSLDPLLNELFFFHLSTHQVDGMEVVQNPARSSASPKKFFSSHFLRFEIGLFWLIVEDDVVEF